MKKIKKHVIISVVIIFIIIGAAAAIMSPIASALSFLFPEAVDTEYISLDRVWEGLDFSYDNSTGPDNRWWYIGNNETTGEPEWMSFSTDMGQDSTGFSQIQKTLIGAQFTKQNLLYFHDLYYEENFIRYFDGSRIKDTSQLTGYNDGRGTSFVQPYGNSYSINVTSQIKGELLTPGLNGVFNNETYDSAAFRAANSKYHVQVPPGYVRRYNLIPASALNNVGIGNVEALGRESAHNRLSQGKIKIEPIGNANSLYLTQYLISDYGAIKDYAFPWQGLYALYLMSDYHEDYVGEVENMTKDELDRIERLQDEGKSGEIMSGGNVPVPNMNYMYYDVEDGLLSHTDDEKKKFIEKLNTTFLPSVTFRSRITDYTEFYTSTEGMTNGDASLYKFDFSDVYPYPTKSYATFNSKFDLSATNAASYRFLMYNVPTSVVKSVDCWYGKYEYEFDETAHKIKKVKKTIDLSEFKEKCEDLLKVNITEGENEREFTEFDMSRYLDYVDMMASQENASDETKEFNNTLRYCYDKSQKEAYYQESEDVVTTVNIGTSPAPTQGTVPNPFRPTTPVIPGTYPNTGNLLPTIDNDLPTYYAFPQNVLSGAQVAEIESTATNDVVRNALHYVAKRCGCAYSQTYRMQQNSFDCSSLVYRAYLAAGLDIGGTTTSTIFKSLYNKGCVVSYDSIQPGDIFIEGEWDNTTHAYIYVGNGKIIEASDYNKGVLMGNVRPASVVFRPSLLIGR